MTLSIYNTLTQQKVILKPLTANHIKLYVCGITVYDYCHIGHGRVMVVFDMITRYLRALGYEVTYVRNITDIDDKIIQRAQAQQESITTLTNYFIGAMQQDFAALNILPPDQEPRATDYLPQMIAIIEKLLATNYAYLSDNGDVYYAVDQFASYGQLAHQSLTAVCAGVRVALSTAKKNPLDFVLWKSAKPSEPAWESPWGLGRPGWHIECSAMSLDCLGEQFDLHGGGFDLIFPHHQNEIAQSEAITHKPLVQTWMHVGFMTIHQEKMSKSLNNFFTIREVLAHYQPEVVRYFMLSRHYRSQLNYDPALLNQAKAAVDRLYLALRGLPPAALPATSEFETNFHMAMQDDFNTPEALSVLFGLAHEIQKLRQQNAPAQAAILGQILIKLGNLFGILQLNADQYLQHLNTNATSAVIENLVAKRWQARLAKDWQTADALRQELSALGIIVEDEADRSVWRYSTVHKNTNIINGNPES